mmetsp:Transcript_37447/g.60121  ORF Transcript_37447/g.60121 Transcript_37447/m.60121 type:complete len:219 (+) Transcript_37447:802-1458(+)
MQVFGGVQGGIMSGRPNSERAKEVHDCPPKTCNSDRYLYAPIAPRLAQCYYEILSEEGRRNIRYKTVFKIRPDHIFNERIPHVGDSIAFRHPEGTVHIWDDQMAVSRRSDAKWILLTPTVAYSTCASEDDWKMACGYAYSQQSFEECISDGALVCETMRLILPYSGAKEVMSLPWTSRQWESGRVTPKVSGHFCIKRLKFLKDNAESRCREEPGCMSC